MRKFLLVLGLISMNAFAQENVQEKIQVSELDYDKNIVYGMRTDCKTVSMIKKNLIIQTSYLTAQLSEEKKDYRVKYEERNFNY